MTFDVVIVGQGLAGSLLAWELLRREYSVLLIDDASVNASRVAAGLINPVTGRRLVKTRDVDTLLPAAMACYERLGDYFQKPFFKPLDMLRVLQSHEERQQAFKRLDQFAYRAYLAGYQTGRAELNAPFGLLRQIATGFLDTRSLLDSLKQYLCERGAYLNAQLHYGDLVLGETIGWQGVSARHWVFCEGYRGAGNPWFAGLPFQPAKGEILHCTSMTQCPSTIINYGHWLIPLGKSEFKTGATFEPSIRDHRPTPEAEQRLRRALAAVCPKLNDIAIVDRAVGIRPATADRQPFVGSHCRQRNLHIFNGFGAKGSLLIPWHAKRFADYLMGGAALPVEADIARYRETHFAA